MCIKGLVDLTLEAFNHQQLCHMSDISNKETGHSCPRAAPQTRHTLMRTFTSHMYIRSESAVNIHIDTYIGGIRCK
jgi:hypothetical protein